MELRGNNHDHRGRRVANEEEARKCSTKLGQLATAQPSHLASPPLQKPIGPANRTNSADGNVFQWITVMLHK